MIAKLRQLGMELRVLLDYSASGGRGTAPLVFIPQ